LDTYRVILLVGAVAGLCLIIFSVVASVRWPHVQHGSSTSVKVLGLELSGGGALGIGVLGVALIVVTLLFWNKEPTEVSSAPLSQPPAAPPAAPGTNAPVIKPVALTPEQRSEIATKIDILGTSNNLHNGFAGVDRYWADTQSRWVGFVKTDRPGFLSIIRQMREVLDGVSSKMSDLRNESREYPDIYALFDEPKSPFENAYS
jgi:hypothetical protein